MISRNSATECSSSGKIRAKGSANTVNASLNVTACFARFVSALSGFHSNLKDILHYSNTPLFPAGLVLPRMNTDFYHPSAQDRRCLESTPAKYASAAAIVPTKSVVRPECHHGEVDHLLLIEPMMTKTIAVRVTESRRECSVRKR